MKHNYDEIQPHFNAGSYSWMHDPSKQLYLARCSYNQLYQQLHVWISINLHACNISAVAMIATVNTTTITITLAIAIQIAVAIFLYTPAGQLYLTCISMHAYMHAWMDPCTHNFLIYINRLCRLKFDMHVVCICANDLVQDLVCNQLAIAMCRSYGQITDFCINQLVTQL